MRSERPHPDHAQPKYDPWNATISHPSYVLKTINMIPTRMNTYAVVEALLKTRHFNSFRFHTYAKSASNQLYNEHLRKNPGGWGVGRFGPGARTYFPLTAAVFLRNDAATNQARRES